MRHRSTLLVPALAFGMAVLAIAGTFVVTRLLSNDDCGTSDTVLATSVDASSLDARQRATAAVVINEGRRLRVPTQGIVIALAVANQESRLPELRQRRTRRGPRRRTNAASDAPSGSRMRPWAATTDRSASSSSSGPGGDP